MYVQYVYQEPRQARGACSLFTLTTPQGRVPKAVQSHCSWAAGVAIRPRDAALGCETLSKAPLNACADQGLDRFAAGYAPRFGHLRRLHHPIPSLFGLHLYCTLLVV